MEKISSDLLHRFRPVKIWREDLDEIIQVFKEFSLEPAFADDEYNYDSLEELEKRVGNHPRLIKISTGQPYITLSLGQENRLWVSSHKYELLFFRLREMIKKRERSLAALFSWPAYFILFTISTVIFYVPHQTITGKLPLYHRVADVVMLLYVIVFIYFQVRGLSILRLDSRRTKSFWSRNADDLYKIIIGAVIGAILTYIGGHYLK